MKPIAFLLLFALPALAQPTFPIPKAFPPDDKTVAEIKAKIEELKNAIPQETQTNALRYQADMRVYLKAAEWMVRHGEWFTEKTAQQTLDVLNTGIERAKSVSTGKTPWLELRDRPIIMGYYSQVDGSIQPYSIRFPENHDPKKKYRVDIVLHGRDATISEVKFIHAKETAKPSKGNDYFAVEIYGRGNNAYRWAGEADVREVIGQISNHRKNFNWDSIDLNRMVLRGFSMGGAGTWHLGLHFPDLFAVMQPGAGFSATRGYHKGLEANPPDYITKGLHIYDAVDYAENCFNIPIVAYSGSKDSQKLAADNIEKALMNFKEPHSFQHIVAPDLEHKQPPEWWAKCDAEIRKHVEKRSAKDPERVRFVTYSTKYGNCDWVSILGLDEHYAKAMIDATFDKDKIVAKTQNVRFVYFSKGVTSVRLDGQSPVVPDGQPLVFVKDGGKWAAYSPEYAKAHPMQKVRGTQGPIDDIFTKRFTVVRPTGEPWHNDMAKFTNATLHEFAKTWDKYFRGNLREATGPAVEKEADLVLFGDPQSNPEIAKVLPNLPIKWTSDKLVINSVEYDAKTHVPMMIYPKGPGMQEYVVLNSGHTFHKDAFVGSNVLLYPRLGDWAVVKPKPTKDDPAAYEVVASGFFDEFWQFKK